MYWGFENSSMRPGHDVGLAFRELQTLLVTALRIVTNELEKERNLVRFAFSSHALDESVFNIVHGRVVVRARSRAVF